MGEIRFKYKAFALPASHPAFPELGRRMAYPFVPVKLCSAGRSVGPALMMLDSGADQCLFKANLGRALGLDVQSGIRCETCGVGGQPHDVWFHKIELDVEGRRFECTCAFTEANLPVAGLLGREGFFSRFQVTLDHRNESITLKYRNADFAAPVRK